MSSKSIPLVALLGLGLLGSWAPGVRAQFDKPSKTEQADKPAHEQRFDQLMAELRKAQIEHNRELRAKIAAARKAMREAKERGEKASVAMPMWGPYDAKPFVPRFWEAANEYAGTDHAIPFLAWIVSNASRSAPEQSKKALEVLITTHIESAALDKIAHNLDRYVGRLGNEIAFEMIDKIIEKSPHDPVRAGAFYARGKLRLAAAKKLEGDARKPAMEQALADYDKAVELAGEADWTRYAKGELREQRQLQIGMPAPDIVGKDLDGVAFKLSDYRGKVVLLSFWGDW
jgi:hypothetical protein